MAEDIRWQTTSVNSPDRARLMGQRPFCLWLTGLPGAGKSTLANGIDLGLHRLGRKTFVLDGDNVRHGLNKDLGFSPEARAENIRRVAEVAKLMVEAGLVVIVAFISPFRKDRSAARALFAEGQFVEVFIDAPAAVCEQRDPKGHYAKARRGELPDFTGIDGSYESPLAPEIRLDTSSRGAATCIDQTLNWLKERGLI